MQGRTRSAMGSDVMRRPVVVEASPLLRYNHNNSNKNTVTCDEKLFLRNCEQCGNLLVKDVCVESRDALQSSNVSMLAS